MRTRRQSVQPEFIIQPQTTPPVALYTEYLQNQREGKETRRYIQAARSMNFDLFLYLIVICNLGTH